VLPESLPRERRMAFTFRTANPVAAMALLGSDRGLSGLALTSFLLSFTHRLFTTVFVLFAAHRHGIGPLEVGAMLAAFALLDLTMQGVLVGPVTQRFGDRPTMIFGLVAAALSLLAMGLAPTAGWFAAALLGTSLWGLSEPTIKSLMSRRVSEREQGQIQGAAQSVIGLAGISGPLFFGWLYGFSSLSMPGLSFVVAAGILVMAALAGAATGRSRLPDRAESAA
jgi:DHA1 family tetracycline resistance protein-like MFS transporter